MRRLLYLVVLFILAPGLAIGQNDLCTASGNTTNTTMTCSAKGTGSYNIGNATDGHWGVKDGGDFRPLSAGRLMEVLTVTDNDAQANTLTVAELVGGITVHTSVTGAANVTLDTAANIIAGSGGKGALTEDGQCYQHLYINDGTEVLTFAVATGTTISDTGQTLAANESAILLICRASSTAVVVYVVGG